MTPGVLAATQPLTMRARLRRATADLLPRKILVRRVAGATRRVALTFDDGPDDMTDGYLEVLQKFGVRVTFFVVGRECAQRPEVLARIVSQGHEVAGHGFTHRRFPELDAASLYSELGQTASLLGSAQSARAMVRPPHGTTSVRSLLRCWNAGYTTVLWSKDSDDCRTSAAEVVEANLTPDRLVPGDIVLLHEGQSWTLAALPGVLQRLKDAGIETVPVSTLLDSACRNGSVRPPG